MINIKIPQGTRIYLTKKSVPYFCIKPNQVLLNDTLYLAYDVKINGEIIIPKGTLVIGNWITESLPNIAGQFQTKCIFFGNRQYNFFADSDVMESVTYYNGDEVGNVSHFSKLTHYNSSSNIRRRITRVKNQTRTLSDDYRDTIYLEINTREIPATIMSDFTVGIE